MEKEQAVDKQEKKQEDWMTKKWRPMMAVMYMICCLMDFAIFPIMFTIVQFWETSVANDAFRQWAPITLQGGGLFHVAMGAVLGVSAYGRTQEKVAGVAGGPTTPTPSLPAPTPMAVAPAPQMQVAMQSAPLPRVEPSYTPVEPAPQVVAGYGGKPGPAPAPQPLL